MRICRAVLVSATALLLCSCGETFTEVVGRHQGDFDTFKSDIEAIAAAIPEKPGEVALAQPLDPLPVFVDGDLTASNTFITPLEQLTDPDFDMPDEKGLDLYLNDVKNLLIWSAWEEKAFDDFEKDLQAAFKLRYAVVYQNLQFKEPAMLDDDTYDRGGVLLGVHIYDLETDKIVCSFPVTAQANEEVSFQYEQGTSGVSEGLRAARSTLWTNAGDALMAALKEKTGGSFDED